MKFTFESLQIFLCLILSTTVATQAQETVTIHPSWNVGDTLVYTSTTRQHESSMGVSGDRLSVEFSITQAILEKRGDSYLISMSYSIDSCYHQESWAREAMSATDGLTYTYIASSTGVFERLEDWTELRDFMKVAIANIIEKLPDPQFRPAIEALMANYTSEENVNSAAISDVVAIHKFYNKPMVVGEREKSTTTSPNITGGAPFTTYVFTELASAPPAGETFDIKEGMSIDQEEFVDAIYNMVAGMLKAQGQEMPFTKDTFASVKNETQLSFTYNENGILELMNSEVYVNAYTMTQVVTTTLQLKEYKPAK